MGLVLHCQSAVEVGEAWIGGGFSGGKEIQSRLLFGLVAFPDSQRQGAGLGTLYFGKTVRLHGDEKAGRRQPTELLSLGLGQSGGKGCLTGASTHG